MLSRISKNHTRFNLTFFLFPHFYCKNFPILKWPFFFGHPVVLMTNSLGTHALHSSLISGTHALHLSLMSQALMPSYMCIINNSFNFFRLALMPQDYFLISFQFTFSGWHSRHETSVMTLFLLLYLLLDLSHSKGNR